MRISLSSTVYYGIYPLPLERNNRLMQRGEETETVHTRIYSEMMAKMIAEIHAKIHEYRRPAK